MSAKNYNYYPLNVSSSFSKEMLTPKKFDLLALGFLFFYSVPLIMFISGVSFFLVVPFSQNVDAANATTLMIMKYFSIIVFMIIAYFSFVLTTDNPHDNAARLSFVVKKKNTSDSGQEESDLVNDDKIIRSSKGFWDFG